jgi:hypothetical protein
MSMESYHGSAPFKIKIRILKDSQVSNLIKSIKQHPDVEMDYKEDNLSEFLVFALTNTGTLRGVFDPKMTFSAYNSNECKMVVYETVNLRGKKVVDTYYRSNETNLSQNEQNLLYMPNSTKEFMKNRNTLLGMKSTMLPDIHPKSEKVDSDFLDKYTIFNHF